MGDSIEKLLALGLARRGRVHPRRVPPPGRATGEDPARGRPQPGRSHSAGAADRGRGPRRLRPAHLGRLRRFRPGRQRTARRDRQLRPAAHRLRRLGPEERVRQESGGSLRVSPGIRRGLHDPHPLDLGRSRQAGRAAQARGDRPRGHRAGEARGLPAETRAAQPDVRDSPHRGAAEDRSALHRPEGGPDRVPGAETADRQAHAVASQSRPAIRPPIRRPERP